MTDGKRERLIRLAWAAVIVPSVVQLLFLAFTMFARLGFPYDLEWMEGGMLHHAARIAEGTGIYVEPSIDFVPYVYTPLYPGVMAMLGGLFGISYALGRFISVASVISTVLLIWVAIVRDTSARDRRPAVAGALLAGGLIAATYPWVEGWYDIVRADSLFVLMTIGGLLGVRSWARSPDTSGYLKLLSAAAVLALAFFCKQTAMFFVASGGAALLVLNWRRVPGYVAVTGAIGLGGVWLLNRVSGGWFWAYVYEVPKSHDFNMDRFYDSFGTILWKFPLMTLLIAAGLLLVAVVRAKRKIVPPSCGPLLYWSPIFAVAVVLGAVGWGKATAHFNVYIPAMFIGALCAGAALPAIHACLRELWPATADAEIAAESGPTPRQGEGHLRARTLSLVVAAAGAAQLVLGLWSPGRFIPDDRDRAAGNALIRRLSETEGEVFVPYHSWYPRMAGKRPHAHLMGLIDVNAQRGWKTLGLAEALRSGYFETILMDSRPLRAELREIRRHYRIDDMLPQEQAPRVFTGAGAAWQREGPGPLYPKSLWVPARPVPPPEGATALFDFESGKFDGWRPNGPAWGRGPRSQPLPRQGFVSRYGGRYYLTSFHGSDQSTGTLTSPDFELTGSRITFKISGGRNPEKLRAELHIGGEVKKAATGNGSERMEEVVWNVAPYRGRIARIMLIDDSTDSWGHLNADEFWLWSHEEAGDSNSP